MKTLLPNSKCCLCDERLNEDDVIIHLHCGHLYHYICFKFRKLLQCENCGRIIRLPEFPSYFILHDINKDWLQHKGVRRYLLQEILKIEEQEKARQKENIKKEKNRHNQEFEEEIIIDSGRIIPF